MKIKYLYITLLCCTIWGCQQRSTTENITLTGKVLISEEDDENFIGTPSYIVSIDDMLITGNSVGDTLFDVWNIHNMERINSFIRRGNGPSELRRIDSFNADNKNKCIYTYDIDNKKLFSISYNDLLKEKPLLQEDLHWNLDRNSPFVLRSTYKMNDCYFAHNLTDTARFIILENNGELHHYEKFPDKTHINPELTEMANAQLYAPMITISPDRKKIAVCGHLSDMIDIIKLSNGKPTIQTTISAYPNDIYLMPIGDGQMQGLCTPKTKRYCISNYATDDYIYAIWKGDITNMQPNSGYLCSNIVRVFDWDGNECYTLTLDKDIFKLTVTPDNKTMYALTDKGGYAIIKYEMDLD